MKILLIGEYSNVHWTLGEGLRALGQDVTVISDGDHWKNYRRDISLVRHARGPLGTARYLANITAHLKDMKGYDVVQIINPLFLELKAEHMYPFYNFLRRNNKHIVLSACGMDYYWVKTGLDCKTFRYGDFNIGDKVRRNRQNDIWINEWIKGPKGELSRYVANDCDGIVAGLYEYERCYQPYFADKTQFIPFPINRDEIAYINRPQIHGGIPEKTRFFIGVQSTRNRYKGTDVMMSALNQVTAEQPQKCEIVKAMDVPYAEYIHMMNDCDVLLDQLYSYTPAMNGLLALAKGMILVGGGEPENYEILGEKELRPIVNVLPNVEDVYAKLKDLVDAPEQIPQRCKEGIEYISRHHDHIKVAKQYLEFYQNLK